MEAPMSSYQITGIPQDVWKALCRMCLEQNISANRKLQELIETEVAQGGIDGTMDSSTRRKEQ
jgi:hypothetical protein